MKFLLSFFIIFTIAIRPVLPLLNYAVNYDYITKNLCEKKDIPQSDCKGKCYISKELSKTEKHTTSQTVKISVIDVFVSGEIFSFSQKNNPEFLPITFNSNLPYSHYSEYFSRIFHPPLV